MAIGTIRLPWARDGRRRRAALVLVVAPALIVALAACGDDEDEGNSSAASNGESSEELSGSIRIDGSSTVYPFAQAAAELFNEEQSGVQITVGQSGTGGGDA